MVDETLHEFQEALRSAMSFNEPFLREIAGQIGQLLRDARTEAASQIHTRLLKGFMGEPDPRLRQVASMLGNV